MVVPVDTIVRGVYCAISGPATRDSTLHIPTTDQPNGRSEGQRGGNRPEGRTEDRSTPLNFSRSQKYKNCFSIDPILVNLPGLVPWGYPPGSANLESHIANTSPNRRGQ